MTKIMLVEDDKSLREIYSIRLVAEGYEVVSAGDGEEALALAVQQKPDLIVSDVMMPKISGFDMLDILRSTPETKDIKVIMMTALSSDDQRQRGESLGADKYLVKSQVGIEDVINAVHEVLDDNNGSHTDKPADTAANTPPATNTPAGELSGEQPETQPTQPGVQPSQPEQPGQPAQSTQPAMQPTQPAESATPQPADATMQPAETAAPSSAEAKPTPSAEVQNSNSAAMDALLSNTPDEQNATWPGNSAQ